MVDLGSNLLLQKRYDVAELLLVGGYKDLAQREAKSPPQSRSVRLKQALERLVRLYEATANKDEARLIG